MHSHASSLLIFIINIRESFSFDVYRSRVAIDYGPRLIGIAKSLGFESQPLITFPNNGNLTLLSEQINLIVKSNSATEVIVGIPADKKGRIGYGITQNFNGIMCHNFSKVLASVVFHDNPKIKVVLVDERYTTQEAKARLRIEKLQASLDAMSACCLLERYIEDRGEGCLPAIPCRYPPPDELANFDYECVRRHVREQYDRDEEEPTLLQRTDAKMNRLKGGGGESGRPPYRPNRR